MHNPNFDMVVDKLHTPLFSGTPDEVRDYLERLPTRKFPPETRVISGRDLLFMTVEEYLAALSPRKASA